MRKHILKNIYVYFFIIQFHKCKTFFNVRKCSDNFLKLSFTYEKNKIHFKFFGGKNIIYLVSHMNIFFLFQFHIKKIFLQTFASPTFEENSFFFFFPVSAKKNLLNTQNYWNSVTTQLQIWQKKMFYFSWNWFFKLEKKESKNILIVLLLCKSVIKYKLWMYYQRFIMLNISSE